MTRALPTRESLRRLSDRHFLGGKVRGLSERIEPPGAPRARKDDANMRLLASFCLAVDANCVDVGAHAGAFLAECSRVAPRGAHIAFEPLPEFAAGLKRRFPDVDVRQVALSDAPGEREFVHVRDRPSHSGLRERDYPGSQELERIPVRVQRLDDALPDGFVPSLVKIDVEGGDHDVILGGAETLRRHRPIVIFEFGQAAASHYGVNAGDFYRLVCDRIGLRIFDLDGNGPYDRDRFEKTYEHGPYFNYVAHP
jgi:FkbM family methyltransferase